MFNQGAREIGAGRAFDAHHDKNAAVVEKGRSRAVFHENFSSKSDCRSTMASPLLHRSTASTRPQIGGIRAELPPKPGRSLAACYDFPSDGSLRPTVRASLPTLFPRRTFERRPCLGSPKFIRAIPSAASSCGNVKYDPALGPSFHEWQQSVAACAGPCSIGDRRHSLRFASTVI